MTARACCEGRRLTALAWAGSVAVHAAALALLSVVRLAPPSLPKPRAIRFFEVQLQQAPPAQVVRVPRAQVAPAPKIQPLRQPKPRPEIKLAPQPKPRPAPTPRARPALSKPEAPPAQPRASTAPAAVAPVKPQPVPRTAARPAPTTVKPAGPSDQPPATGPSGGGGPVDLGSPSPAGDLGGLGSGSTPVGGVPGSGTGSGSGTGPGSGSGPPGTSPPGGGGGPPGAQPGDHPPAGQPGGKPPEPEPRPKHVSRLADRALPELISRVNPQYPPSAAADGAEGTVGLIVTVGPDGSVEKVSVASSSGDKRLDSAAVSAVRKWKYKPAVQNGEARRVDTRATVTFRLN